MRFEFGERKVVPSRRRFLQASGAGLAASAIAALRSPIQAAAASDVGSRNIPFELGLASYSLRKFSLDDALAMTNRVGLKHICLKSFHLPLDATPEQIREAAAKCKAARIDLYGAGVITMRNAAEVDQAFEYAKAAGITTIVGVPFHDVLPLVDKKVKEYDIVVAIHNHGPGDKNYPTPESVYEKVKGLDRRIGLCMDVGHTVRIGADPVRDCERFADRLLDVHIKDVTATNPGGGNIEAGRGVIDLPALLAKLVELRYSRIVAFEFEKDPDDPLPGLAETVGYVRGVIDTLSA